VKTRTVPSRLDVRIRRPSRLKVALVSGIVWPRRNGSLLRPVIEKSRPVEVLHNPAVNGPPVTTQCPSGLNEADWTALKWPRSKRWSLPVATDQMRAS
jgi:hypothetical protein